MENQNSAPSLEDPAVSAASNLVRFKTSRGLDVEATLVKLMPQSVSFELYRPLNDLRLSEALSSFKVIINDQPIYENKAVISSVVQAGTVLVCEATLEGPLLDGNAFGTQPPQNVVDAGYKLFLKRWQGFYKILPEYKLVVADMQSFLSELRLWMDQMELGIRSIPPAERLPLERTIVEELVKHTAPAVSSMFERFEVIASSVPPELAPAHHAFCRRQLHPLLLSSPFMHRIYTKPLGYAGDYEMVNMILRDPFEGGSLFAKLLNVFILRQVPAEAHRNRVTLLVQKLLEESNRAFQQGNICRIYNLGCGPAGEIQKFVAQHELSNYAQFTLLDADEETLQYTGGLLENIKLRHARRTSVKTVKKSVHQLLKQHGRPTGEQFDFIYSAGLFDYLSDRVGKTIIEVAYEMLSPGGLLLITNVDSTNPIRNIMEHIYEWYLIYRSGVEFKKLAADLPGDASVLVCADETSGNIFLEVRKPA